MVAVIEANGWGALVEAGKFEELKATLSLEATKTDFLNMPTHRSITDVFSKPTATLATVKKYRGEVKLQAVVEHLLKSAAKFVNVGKGMNEWQIAETARMIASEYYYLTVADLKVCFRNGISGKYGQLFDRLDGQIVLNWLITYDAERTQFAEMESTKHMKAKAEGEKATYAPEWVKQWLANWEAKRKSVFNDASSNDAKGLKFWNLQAFLQHIGKDSESDKTEIWQLLETNYEHAKIEIDFDAYAIYQSNVMLVKINKGEITDWGSLVNFLKTSNEDERK